MFIYNYVFLLYIDVFFLQNCMLYIFTKSNFYCKLMYFFYKIVCYILFKIDVFLLNCRLHIFTKSILFKMHFYWNQSFKNAFISCIFTGRCAESKLNCNAWPTHDGGVASNVNNRPSPKISLIYWLTYG